jgi:hypothetical protein
MQPHHQYAGSERHVTQIKQGILIKKERCLLPCEQTEKMPMQYTGKIQK